MSVNQEMLHVFVSYATEDRYRAKLLADRLTADGFDAWWDREKLQSGDDWKSKTKIANSASDVGVCCLTPTALENKRYFRKEIQFARQRADDLPPGTSFFLPVQLKRCAKIPSWLRDIHCETLFHGSGYSKLRTLLQTRARDLQRVVTLVIPQVLAGTYTATGNNSNGEQYQHHVRIVMKGEHYEVNWILSEPNMDNVKNEEIVIGAGCIRENSFVIESSEWNFAYEIHADGSLSAEWEEGAFERLTLKKRDEISP